MLPAANDVLRNDVLRNDVMLRINDVALRANGLTIHCFYAIMKPTTRKAVEI